MYRAINVCSRKVGFEFCSQPLVVFYPVSLPASSVHSLFVVVFQCGVYVHYSFSLLIFHIPYISSSLILSTYDIFLKNLISITHITCGWIQCILIMKANEMHYFSNLFDKILYMFQTSLLSIIRSISTLCTCNRYLSC
jgi:hypothetical protein